MQLHCFASSHTVPRELSSNTAHEMRPIAFAIFLAVSVLFVLVAGERAEAQRAGSLFSSTVENSTDSADARIGDIMRQAAENGVGVVVIDTEGNVVSTVAEQPDQLDAAEVVPATSAIMELQDRLYSFRANLVKHFLGLPAAFNEVLWILRATSPDGTIWAYFQALYTSALLFAVGIVVEKRVYGRRFARKFVVARSKDKPEGYAEKMPFLVFRFFMGVTGILVSMAVAYVIGFAIFGPLTDPGLQFTVGIINTAYFLTRSVAQLWRMVLSPFLEQYRMPMLSTSDAKRLYYWLIILGGIDIVRLLFAIWISELGLNYDVYAFMSAALGAIVVALNIVMVLVNRVSLSNAIRQGQPKEECSWIVRTLSVFWAPAVIVYMLYAWLRVTYELISGTPPKIPLIAGAYGILLSILVVYGVINFFIERYFARARALRELNERSALEEDMPAFTPDGMTAQDSDFEGNVSVESLQMRGGQMKTFEALAQRVAGILAFVAGTYAFFYIWGREGSMMAESLSDRLLDVMAIVFIGYIIYHAFRIWIDNKIEEEQGDQPVGELGDEGGASSASRLATLLPLFRNFILIVLFVTMSLIVLMELGVNVGPLFAGAGVIGVAIGFGSQALVRDIFSGAFFLFDDAFRKGEYLDVGGVKGTVEKISVRSFQLRHHLGALHTIPFGELQVMTNYSRDWVIMKLPLRVTYDTDVEHVRKLIKNLGVELLSDPVIGENFIQPLKSQGVIEMLDSAMIIRVKFMTKPGDQWLVRKKVYEEIRALFEQEGIQFAHKEVTVRIADGKADDLTDRERKAVTSAAEAAIEEDLLDDIDYGDER